MKGTIIALIFLSAISSMTTWSEPLYGQSNEILIEEIIVTARRREESLREVPGTVTAFSQTTLERAGVERAADFIALTPGVTIVDAAEVGDRVSPVPVFVLPGVAGA